MRKQPSLLILLARIVHHRGGAEDAEKVFYRSVHYTPEHLRKGASIYLFLNSIPGISPVRAGSSLRSLCLCGAIFGLVLCAFGAPVRALEGLPEAANWIANPSFEVGSQDCPVDWVFLNQHEATTGSWGASDARTGRQGVGLRTQTGMAYGRWITPYAIPFGPATKGRVSFWYRGTGAQVYLAGQASSLAPDGRYESDLSKTFKLALGPTPATSEWTCVEAEFTTPGYASWAQLTLGVHGKGECSFDDVTLTRAGLLLVEPATAWLAGVGETNRLVVYAEELRNVDPAGVTWQVDSAVYRLLRVTPEPAKKTWALDIVATRPGVADITIQAIPRDGAPLSLALPRAARAYEPTGGTFAFVAMTDLHFYRPGANERNEKFGRLAGSVNALDPLFALSLGDQLEIHSGLRDEEKKLRVMAAREQLARVEAPLFLLAGNHEIDKTYEGAATQWYHEKLLGAAPNYAFQVDGTLFAGFDVTSPGLCQREHGASFQRAGQAEWLARQLGTYTGRLPIVAAHITPYTEFVDGSERDFLMNLLFTNRVRAYLSGHLHYTQDRWVRNPAADGKAGPSWPEPRPLTNSAILADPGNTAFLTTTTGSAFMLGDVKMNGYRYVLVRDQEIVWQDVLPLSLSIARENPAPNRVVYTLSNGVDKAVSGLPLRADLPPGKVTATRNGVPLAPRVTVRPDGRQAVWVQADVATQAVVRVEVQAD